MRRWKRLIVVLLLVGGIVGGAWYGARQLAASFAYSVQVECESLPPDDEPLELWLKSQPGVFGTHVSREGKTMKVSWGMGQYLFPRRPPTPNLRAALEQFGYGGVGPIRDDPPRTP